MAEKRTFLNWVDIGKSRPNHRRSSIILNPTGPNSPLKNGIFNGLCALQGCTAIFDDDKSLKMREAENRIFRFPH